MAALKTLVDYGAPFQVKTIGALLTRKEFVQNIYDILSDEHFPNPAHKWIINEILQYWNKYHTVISMDTLKIEVKKIDNDVLKTSIVEQIKEAYRHSDDELQYVEEEFTAFCKNQQLKTALLNSVDLLNSGDYDSIRHLIDNALKAGQDRNIGHEYNKDIETRYREDYRPTIPTPWPMLNQLTQGGFGAGDLGIVFGNPGGGKSWMMVALAAHAVKMGYNVVYYTLELGQDYVGKRFDCYFTGHSIEEVQHHRPEVESIVEGLAGKLVVKEYPPKAASVATLKAHLQKCIDADIKPDMVVIDYIDYLRPPSKKFTERKDEIDDMYVACKGLAKEFKVVVLSPSQVNRMGAKDDIIEGDKAAGSYDKIMVADFCLSLSRKKEDKVHGTGRVHVMKNRYGMDGMTFGAKIDTNNGHIELTEDMPTYEDSTSNTPTTFSQVDSFDKKELAKKFMKLSSFS
jgi:archaellum biogenesis ATPase FlaH